MTRDPMVFFSRGPRTKVPYDLGRPVGSSCLLIVYTPRGESTLWSLQGLSPKSLSVRSQGLDRDR